MNRSPHHDTERILRDGKAIDKAITATHQRVVLLHQQMKVPLVTWRNGEAVEVPPESVQLSSSSA